MKTKRAMMGYSLVFSPDRPNYERDFVLCGHCQESVDINPNQSVTDAGGYCSGCDKVICNRCTMLMHRSGLCQPFEVELQIYEMNVKALRRMGYDGPFTNTGKNVLPLIVALK